MNTPPTGPKPDSEQPTGALASAERYLALLIQIPVRYVATSYQLVVSRRVAPPLPLGPSLYLAFSFGLFISCMILWANSLAVDPWPDDALKVMRGIVGLENSFVLGVGITVLGGLAGGSAASRLRVRFAPPARLEVPPPWARILALVLGAAGLAASTQYVAPVFQYIAVDHPWIGLLLVPLAFIPLVHLRPPLAPPLALPVAYPLGLVLCAIAVGKLVATAVPQLPPWASAVPMAFALLVSAFTLRERFVPVLWGSITGFLATAMPLTAMLDQASEPKTALGYLGMRDGVVVLSQSQEGRHFSVRWACPIIAAQVAPLLVAEPEGQGVNVLGTARVCATGWFRDGEAILYRVRPCWHGEDGAECRAMCVEKDVEALKRTCRENLGDPRAWD